MIGAQLHLLRQFGYASGLTDKQELSSIKTRDPNGRWNYVKGFLIELYLTIAGASTSDAITARQMFDMVRELSLTDNAGRRILFDTPVGLHILRNIVTYLTGKGQQSVTAISADSNTTNTRKLYVYVPLEQPLLEDRDALIQPAAMLNHGTATVKWSGDGLGTGQTIGAGSYVRIYADVVGRDDVEHRAEMFIGVKVPSTFSGDRVPLNGRVMLFGVGIEGPTATLASNDWTDYGLEGRETSVPRGTDIDTPTNILNRHIRDIASEKTLPSAGSIVDFPLIAPVAGEKLSDMPYEDNLIVYMTSGAGAPGVADQSFFYVAVRPKNTAGLANALGATQAVKGNAGEWAQQLASANAGGARGRSGGLGPEHKMSPFVASKVPTNFRGA